ncbi:MAG: HAD-IIIA family hydrolase [Clostridia bacterium]|nr:HAD-IIIA family hydrolase [Clostridia bacterium]
MVAVILAGGQGKRVKEIYGDIPKPMIEMAGKPVLQWQIESLKAHEIKDFLIIVGYKHHGITSYFGDGSRFGVHIDYYTESEPMGTAGALFQLDLPEEFLLLNGDLVFDFTLIDMLTFHRKKEADITLFTHPTSHPFDSMIVRVDACERVLSMQKGFAAEKTFSNLGNAGICVIKKKALDNISHKAFMSLDEDVIIPNIEHGNVFSYCCAEYVKDAGTPERIAQIEAEIKSGLPALKKNAYPKKAVFLDRDGTVNRYKGYISSPEQIELIPGAAQAINTFHRLGYFVMIITNQPVVARGECSEEELKLIHNRLQYLLAKENAYIDDIFYCPHHPDSGFEDENKAYKCECDCRKPKPGMILKAAGKWNLDLKQSWMAGDSESDVQTAVNAGCRPILISKKENDNAVHYATLKEFAEALEKNEKYIG